LTDCRQRGGIRKYPEKLVYSPREVPTLTTKAHGTPIGKSFVSLLREEQGKCAVEENATEKVGRGAVINYTFEGQGR